MFSAAVAPHKAQKQRAEDEKLVTLTPTQPSIAQPGPLLFKSRLERASCSGPTARKDTEAIERNRWLDSPRKAGQIFPNPNGSVTRDRTRAIENSSVVVADALALSGTEFRRIRKFLNFTSSTFKVDFLSSIDYYTAYLRMRVSEPCTRCCTQAGPHVNRISRRGDRHSKV